MTSDLFVRFKLVLIISPIGAEIQLLQYWSFHWNVLYQLIKVRRRTYRYVAKDADFIPLDWRELLLHFYYESKDYIKYITETKEAAWGMKGVKDSNDSASPSPFLFTKEVVV
jgi:hypothetical protein